MDEANRPERDHGGMRHHADCRYLVHDRDTKYTQSFRAIIASGRVEPLALPARGPNLNGYAERWVSSVKECLSKVILLGDALLRRALNEYLEHYHAERNHQGKGNVLLFPRDTDIRREPQPVQCRERLGGAPALLPSTGGMIARPRFNRGTPILRAAIGRSRKSRKPLSYPSPQLCAPASSITLRSTVSSAVTIFCLYAV